MLIIGIDPGVSGGIAYHHGSGVTLVNIPETEADIIRELYAMTEGEEWFAFIEWIHPAIQGISKSAMSKLYGSYMALRMALTANKIPFEVVKPEVWQKAIGMPRRNGMESNKWKNCLKAKAQQLFPKETITKDTADALLIAEYGRRLRAGEFSK